MTAYWPDPDGDHFDDNDSMAERGAMAPLTGEGCLDDRDMIAAQAAQAEQVRLHPLPPPSHFADLECEWCGRGACADDCGCPTCEAERALDGDADAYFDRASDPND